MTRVELVNLALTALGTTTITSLDDDSSEEARVMNILYDSTMEEVLSLFAWPSALHRDKLARLAEVNYVKWAYGYQLPEDCVWVVNLLDPDDFSEMENVKGSSRPSPTSTPLFEREGSVLYTDLEDCYIKYVKFPTDTESLRDIIAVAVAYKLAQNAVASMGRDLKKEQRMENRFEVALLRAKAAEAKDWKGEPVEYMSWGNFR